MVRSFCQGTLVAVLVWPCLAWGQQPSQPAAAPEPTNNQFITLQEPGKPEQKCRVLRTWQEKGNLVKEVQDQNSGEVMRVVEGTTTPEGGRPLVKPMSRVPGVISRVFHSDRNAKGAQSQAPNYLPNAVPATNSQIVPVQATSRPMTSSNVQQATMSTTPSAATSASQGVQPARSERLIKVQEPGKPVQNCRVLRAWKTSEGALAREVQDVLTGETLTIVEAGLTPAQSNGAPGQHRLVANRIFHWGTSQARPESAPVPPVVVDATPPGGSFIQCAAANPSGNGAVASCPCVPCGNGAVASCPCVPCGNAAVASCPCAPCGNCAVASGPCGPCTTVVTTGPCATGNSAVATGPCPADCCSACGPCSPPSGGLAAVPTDGQPPVIVSTTLPTSSSTASRPPFWKRWFGSKETVAKDCGDCKDSSSVATTSPTPYATSPSGTKLTRDVATPTDWRRSWGKPDASQSLADCTQPQPTPAWPKDFDRTTAQSNSSTTTATPPSPAKAATQTAVKPATTQAANTKPAQKPTAPQTANAKPTELPKADKRTLDPLTDQKNVDSRAEVKKPDPRALAQATKAVENKVSGRSDAQSTPPTPPPPTAVLAQQTSPAPKKTEEKGPAGKATTTAKAPLGSQSVLAAYDGKPTGPVCYLPVPMVTLPQRIPPAPPGLATSAEAGKATATKEDDSQVNAFTPPSYGGGKGKTVESPMANAFTGGISPNATAMAYPGAPGMGMPPAMGRSPMAAMPVPMPINPVGYLPPTGRPMMPPMPPAMPVPGPQTYMAPPPGAPATTPQQLVNALQNALYPSQRERAAESLAKCDCKAHPEVVDALVLAAREDPAATVRSACVRCLGKVSANSPGVTTALQALRTDTDPQVRQAADEVLGGDGSTKSDAAKVQPAGAIAPEAEKK